MNAKGPWFGGKAAVALAARMTREMIHWPEKLEAEWQTADRPGYSAAVVRQARWILQDFGVVRCQRGRKGALWGAPASLAGVIGLPAAGESTIARRVLRSSPQSSILPTTRGPGRWFAPSVGSYVSLCSANTMVKSRPETPASILMPVSSPDPKTRPE